jgi:hypothetical protein
MSPGRLGVPGLFVRRRRALSAWLRTGRLPVVRTEAGVELQFDPWHDPENGRFTFADIGRHHGWGREGPPSRDSGNKLASTEATRRRLARPIRSGP